MRLSPHAEQQIAARHIYFADLAQAIRYGERFESEGRNVFALGSECGAYPEPLPYRLRGLVVVVANDETVVTAYRSPRPGLRERLTRRCAS